MDFRVVTDGKDPLTKPVLDYLAAKYGMQAEGIRALELQCSPGDVQVIKLTLLVDPEVIIGA